MPKTRQAPTDTPHTDTPARNGHLPDEVAQDLINRINSGALPVGGRLPSERDLCAQYSVSRAVIREALSQLKSDGLVTARAGSGVYVRQPNSTNAFRFKKFSVSDLTRLEEAMELLITIEVAATRIAARRRTTEDLKKIKRTLIGMEYAIASDRLGDEEDYQFHQSIVAATHNQHFISLCQHLEASARNIIRQARSNTKTNHSELLDAVQDEHKEIYKAIEQGDEERAAVAAARHLQNASQRIRTYLA
ncbi:FadR/GntR family transcriptional regulator [Celeribacter halophilus]|jgi:DNA-binding FadR family transcriptional regulator|uniref:DNA-binding transcriptional regulator, FadR family n=1 Tax=Celeribacter halophilus TaxID=576117 RepID=A0A1I3WRM2_9RHOB|nr:FadR/GntR family transcriptional regulator [Celeribacter halophilus]PZX06022.1 DNA-binding FadR family transcriptional regulator [Celeribacter halophilus]SFK10122.1 DNA-binding transcriptional regulator, FadR family [Celeribacter halophilus]